MKSFCNQSEIKFPYFVNVPINISTYGYQHHGNLESCWMRCDDSLPKSHWTDPSFLQSEAESTLAGVLAGVLSIPGTILNLLVILVIIRTPDLRKEYLTPSIASITLTDFLLSLYVLPTLSHHNIKREVSFIEGCNFQALFSWGLWMVSIFNLVGIAGLRCFAINYPRKTKNESFQYCCTIIPIMAWALTLIFFLPSLTHQYGQIGMKCKIFSCIIINVDNEGNPVSPDPMGIYFMIIILSGMVLLILNIVSYVQVSKQSRKLFDQIKLINIEEATKILKNEKRLGKMVGIITASFFLVYVPLVVIIMAFRDFAYENPIVGVVSFFFSWLLVVIDPLIYIYSNEKYRNGIRIMLNPILSRVSALKPEANRTSEKETNTGPT